MGTRFVSVPADSLLDRLGLIANKIENHGGQVRRTRQGREIVWEFQPRNRTAFVRVYTTLAVGGSEVRDCGKDAVRIVVGATVGDRFKPLAPPRKMLRTAPKMDTEQARVESFLDRLEGALRESYTFAVRDLPTCPQCNSVMARRKGKHGDFFGCVTFPECRGTRQISA